MFNLKNFIVIILLVFNYVNAQGSNDSLILEKAYKLDSIYINKIFKEILKKKKLSSDKIFYKQLIKGIEYEQIKNYKKANKKYSKAIYTVRFETPPFEASFSKARILIITGEKMKGIKLLKEFIKFAENTINRITKRKTSLYSKLEITYFKLRLSIAKEICENYQK